MATIKVEIVVIIVLVMLSPIDSLSHNSNNSELLANGVCPTWYIEKEGRCECGGTSETDKFIRCQTSENKTSVEKGYCVTYDNTSRLVYAGSCPYHTRSTKSLFDKVASDVQNLNDKMCGLLNRTGLLCSQCQPGLGPAVFSYYRQCINCIRQPFGWILFVARVTVPMTLFCVIVIIFQINIASPALNGFVLMSQLIATEYNNNPFLMNGLERGYSLIQTLLTCFGFWNLDFFTYCYQASFCISEGMSMLTVLALEYTVALYPIIFTIVVYCCITLHDNGCKILVFCWKPFHRCLARVRQRCDLKGSVIKAFATFVLLSYCKFCSISLNLIQSVEVWDENGGKTQRVYYDASYQSLSTKHIPYVVLSSIIIIIFVCLPALFILFYQNKFFQTFLGNCKFRCVLIHELANTTQGCFKNGTTPGTRDYRWFAGLYLLLRIALIFSVNQQYSQLIYILVSSIMVFLVATVRPYRLNRYNVLDSLFWLSWVISTSWRVYYNAFDNVWRDLSNDILLAPLVYIICYVIWRIIKQYKLWIAKRRRQPPLANEENNAQGNDDEQLPDRLLRPNEYTPLIPPSNES